VIHNDDGICDVCQEYKTDLFVETVGGKDTIKLCLSCIAKAVRLVVAWMCPKCSGSGRKIIVHGEHKTEVSCDFCNGTGMRK